MHTLYVLFSEKKKNIFEDIWRPVIVSDLDCIAQSHFSNHQIPRAYRVQTGGKYDFKCCSVNQAFA